MARAAFLERNASFPGNEIVLGELLGFGSGFAAGELDYAVQDFFAHLWNGFFAGDYGTGVDVIAGGALEIKAGLGGVFGIVEDGGDGRSAAFFCGAGGLHGVGEQAIAV